MPKLTKYSKHLQGDNIFPLRVHGSRNYNRYDECVPVVDSKIFLDRRLQWLESHQFRPAEKQESTELTETITETKRPKTPVQIAHCKFLPESKPHYQRLLLRPRQSNTKRTAVHIYDHSTHPCWMQHDHAYAESWCTNYTCAQARARKREEESQDLAWDFSTDQFPIMSDLC